MLTAAVGLLIAPLPHRSAHSPVKAIRHSNPIVPTHPARPRSPFPAAPGAHLQYVDATKCAARNVAWCCVDRCAMRATVSTHGSDGRKAMRVRALGPDCTGCVGGDWVGVRFGSVRLTVDRAHINRTLAVAVE